MQNFPAILHEGILPRNKTPYFIRPLTNTMNDLMASDALQANILKTLGDIQTLIHPQTWRHFMRRRDGVHGVALGVFEGFPNGENARLIAQQDMSLTADPTVPLLDGLDSNQIACTQGFMVHPEYRGNKLTDILLHHMHEIGEKEYGKIGFMSCADASNPFSYNVIMSNGYGVTHVYVDPSDGGKTYAFLRLNNPSVASVFEVPKIEAGHFEEIQSLLQSAPQPVIIYQKGREKVCSHQGQAFRPDTYQTARGIA